MIQIQQLKLPVSREDGFDTSLEEGKLYERAAGYLHVPVKDIKRLEIKKKSLDARKKPELWFCYTLWVELENEEKVLKRSRDKNISKAAEHRYVFPVPSMEDHRLLLRERPVIVGAGPAGLFCALELAKAGYRPLIIERGEPVEKRLNTVKEFWETGKLKKDSNVQFGEGGAGTFSDGKLNTLVKDIEGRSFAVLSQLVQYGAPPRILYENKPHVGTDVLCRIMTQMRAHLLSLGAEILFETKVTRVLIEEGRLTGLEISEKGGEPRRLSVEAAVFAIGHSARDTFEMLCEEGIPMQPKAFAVGLRIEHPQSMINESQYGAGQVPGLPAAAYKLTHKASDGRGVYSFCMCPGGYVVNASSEDGMLAVNGMSNSGRDGVNANAAIIVTVSPGGIGGGDYPVTDPLSGIDFQRKLEAMAYQTGRGDVPVQLFGDFVKGKESKSLGAVEPQIKGQFVLADLNEMLPQTICSSLKEGIEAFDKKIQGFGRYDAVLSGVESRTSSPVRIPRDEKMESSVAGFYPCGEGAGYAGGIMSAAMDGMKAAEEIAKKYKM